LSRIRITGGEWRSRLIQVAEVPGLRPTPDRVRETLFNWLGQDLSGLRCLDAFGGSGILGFEAASRGAEHVVILERERHAYLRLRQHAEMFRCPRIETICCDAIKFAPLARFDLVFLDPPFRQGWLERVGPRLSAWVNPGARLYVEAEAPLDKLDPGWAEWRAIRQGQAGQVFFHLLEQA
jgi:16S rRNA (guanine(966)-N(2))-methyltransferase RsmD